jgi:hypothetical protein
MVPSMSSASATQGALGLTVGCTFELETTFPIAAIMQVAPGLDPTVRMQREVWDTAGCDHHGYVDLYANRWSG